MTINTDYVEELRAVIRRLHGAEANHVQSVNVKEEFEGRTIWDETVGVFDLEGHPNGHRVYAWAHDTDAPDNPRRYITILHLHPVKSARDAVTAAIVQEFRSLEPSE